MKAESLLVLNTPGLVRGGCTRAVWGALFDGLTGLGSVETGKVGLLGGALPKQKQKRERAVRKVLSAG